MQGQASALCFQPTFLLLLQHEHPGSGLSTSEEPDQTLAILLAGQISSACARLLPLVSLAEFCTGCCLTKKHDTAHWHDRLATESQAAQKTQLMLALQVMAVWLKQQTSNIEIQAEVASNNHSA